MRALIKHHPLAGCTHDTELMQRQWLQVRPIAGVRVGALSCDTRSRMHSIMPGNVRVRSSPNPNKWTDQSQNEGKDANENAQLAFVVKKVCQFASVKLYTCVLQKVCKCATRIRSRVCEGEWQIHLSETLSCDLPVLCTS